MDDIKKSKYKNLFPSMIAMIQWYITTLLQIDRKIFVYSEETGEMIVVKGLYLGLLLVAWNFVFLVIEKAKKGEELYKRGIQVFTFYFTLMLLLLLVLWPGTWSWDDIGILNGVLKYTSFVPWQHFLSGLYQAVLLQVIPHPGGIILIQNVIVSICVAFSIVKLETCFDIKCLKNKYLDLVVKILPFITPPVLLYQFSGYRMGVYVYIELVMLIMVICAVKEEKEWTWKYSLFFVLLTAIVAAWRSESLFYVFTIPLVLLLIQKKIIPVRKKIICIVLIFVAFFSINKIQNSFLVNNDYQIISMMGPYATVVRSADLEEDKEELEAIDKVVDIDVIHSCPDWGGEALYWGARAYRSGYTSEEYANSIIATIKLAIKYPKQVFLERWNLFLNATGVTGGTWAISYMSVDLFGQDDGSVWDEWFAERGYFPPFKKIRAATINILSCNTINGNQIGILRRIVWNAWIPILSLIYAWFNCIKKRQWSFWIICSAVIVRIPVVYLTEPSGWIMYLLSFYFLGYVYLVYEILIRWSQHKQMKESITNE